MIRLSYISFFVSSPQFNTYFENLNFWFKFSPLSSTLFTHKPNLLIFHSEIFLSHKKSLLFKIPDDVILHVICGSLPPNQKSWLRLFLCLIIFLLNQSKNSAVLEPRTGQFWTTCRLRDQGQGLELRGQDQGLQNASSRKSLRPRTSFRTHLC